MGLWPLQNVVLYRTAYERIFVAPRASAGYCVWLAAAFGIILIPIFLAYGAGGLWIKEAFYREQPIVIVKFQHEVVVAVQGDTTTSFFSTDPKLNELNAAIVKVPSLRYSEEDFDTDGKPDQLTVKISMPITEQARRVFFLGTFGYTLQETVRLSMKGLIAADESCGVGATGVTMQGFVDFRQNNAMRTLPEPRTTYMTSPLDWDWTQNIAYTKLAPFTFSGLLESYSQRNETIRFTPDVPPIWHFAPSKTFDMTMKVQVPNQVVYYVPGALEELKHAWVHIASFLLPVYFVLSAFLGFIFTNQIVHTYCCSQLPYINSK